jgi:hypothetical protein
MQFESLMRLMADFTRTYSKSAPPVIVHSRYELVKEKLAHRARRRSLARVYRAITGESLHSVHRRAKRLRARAPR